jgi:HPt (histidine-containing phosphotransfer) domain-containing protein
MIKGAIAVTVNEDLKPLIPAFLKNRTLDLVNLDSALGDLDFKKIDDIAHSLKGVAGSFGFHLLAKIGAEIQLAAKSSDTAGIRRLLSDGKDFMTRVSVSYS